MVVTLTTPPIIGLIGTLLRRLKGTRHVYWSMDLHPDASLALGRMSPRNPVVARPRLAERLRSTARPTRWSCSAPTWPTGSPAKGVRARPDRDDPRLEPPRRDLPASPASGNPLRESLGLDDKFVAMYSGNLGLAHSFDEFLEAARRLRDRDDIVFLFVGDGPRLAEVRAAQEAEGLTNIRFLDYFPREQLHASLSLADVHLISMRPEMTGIVVPGKLYGVDGGGPAGPLRRPRALRVGRHDPPGRLRLDRPPRRRRRPGRGARPPWPPTPSLARRMGERGRSAFLAEHERNLCC